MAFDIGGFIGGLGGLLGKKSKPPTPSEMVIGAAEGARKAADMYGFNPLTMLRLAGGNAAAGGGGYPGPDMSGALAALGGIFDDAAKSWAGAVPGSDPIAQAIRARELDRLQSGTLSRQKAPPSFGYNLQTNTTNQPVTVSTSPLTTRPRENPFIANSSRRWVHAPNGDLVNVPADIADRLGVQTGGNLMAGDWTELHGELVGEAEVAVNAIPISRHSTGTGLTAPDPGPRPPRPKQGYRAQLEWDRKYGGK